MHVCTLPITQVVSVFVGWLYWYMHPELTAAESAAAVGAILLLFQITPISPGSLVRGLYVVYMVVKDRNFKDYNIAVFLGFFKYIGYLAFPIQMTYRYPEIARFMAGHWATEAVHIVPVFGEGGALLEHWVFNIFYNWPLTVRSRMKKISELRVGQKSRFRHVPLMAIAAAALMGLGNYAYLNYKDVIKEAVPALKTNHWTAILVVLMGLIILIGSALVTRGCRGAALGGRIVSASVWGVLTGILHTLANAFIVLQGNFVTGDVITAGAWNVFIFTVVATIWAVVTELRMPDPDLKPGHAG